MRSTLSRSDRVLAGIHTAPRNIGLERRDRSGYVVPVLVPLTGLALQLVGNDGQLLRVDQGSLHQGP
jgi:hypothetical protein